MIERNSRGLTEAIFDELDKLKSGESTPAKANSVAKLANTACAITRLEMDYMDKVKKPIADANTLDALPMGESRSE